MTTAEYLRGWNDCMRWMERTDAGAGSGLPEAIAALIEMVRGRMERGDDPWWNDEQRAVWVRFNRAATLRSGKSKSPHDDCHDCGTCDECVERSAAHFDEQSAACSECGHPAHPPRQCAACKCMWGLADATPDGAA